MSHLTTLRARTLSQQTHWSLSLVATLAYEAGNKFSFVPVNTNTGAVTINIESLGAQSIVTAAGNALNAGDLAAGSRYQIEYDGTNFVIDTSVVDLGAIIANLSEETTILDADKLAFSDASASDTAKYITLANLRDTLALGLILDSEQEPTSDVSEIAVTSLSVYRDVTVIFLLEIGNNNLDFECRSSAGTWRTLARLSAVGGTSRYWGSITFRNFGRNNDVKISHGSFGSDSNSVDRSDNSGETDAGGAVAGWSTYTEQWDEFRIAPTGGNIEGSDADKRAYVAIYGEGTGD